MAEAASAAGAVHLHCVLPDEIVTWEILVRLPPKSLLRCRTACRAWHRVSSTRSFLLAHHARQPALPIISGGRNLLAFDHQAAAAPEDQLHTVARLDEVLYPQASCDGLLILDDIARTCFSICNPATREHALLRTAGCTRIMGMYLHRPTGEYRLLLYGMAHRRRWMLANSLPVCEIGCYVLAVGSDQTPRYIGWPETAPPCFDLTVLLRDNLHWCPSQSHCRALIVFDTVAETFRQMHAPIASSGSYVFEMDDMLGIYNHNNEAKIVDIWVLQNYENETWDFKYRIELPVAEIRRRFEGCDGYCAMSVVSEDGDVLLLVSFREWLLHIDSDGKLVESFNLGGQRISLSGLRLKHSLLLHTFLTTLEGYAVNASPFI